MPGTPAPLAERLNRRLKRMPNGCLEWTGSTDKNGYGKISLGRRAGNGYTHRLAWMLEHGPIPPGLKVLHHCDNPPCCDAIDTEHLFLGTQADNMADMTAKGRRRGNSNETKTHCPANHEYTKANTYVRPNGWRVCRTCARADATRRRAVKQR